MADMFRVSLMTALLVGGVMPAALADPTTHRDRLVQCLGEQDSLRRLACLESVAQSLIAASPPAGRLEAQDGERNDATAPQPAPTRPAEAQPAGERSASTPAQPVLERTSSGARITRDPDGRPSVIGEWAISRSTDSMTDRPRITLMAEGEMEVGRSGSRLPLLVIRCFSGRLEVFWDSGQFIGTRDTFATTLRFDNGQPQQQRWSSSTSGRAVFAPNAAQTMNSLFAARERLLIETVAFSGERYRAQFDIAGIQEAAAELASCWRPPQPAAARPAGTQQRPSSPAGAAR